MKQKSGDQDQPMSDTDDLSNDGTGNSGSAQNKAKVNLMKFSEDEALGDLATQAMPLFSNLSFPNLRTDMPDLSERFKHVTKLWRKLDAASKLIYVNKARQNRYKKKSDEKASGKSSIKRSKSPNSDKQSDAEFSRSGTPLTETPENSQHMNDMKQQRQQPQAMSLNNAGANQFIQQLNVVKSDENQPNVGFIQMQQQTNQPPKIIQLSNNNQIPIGFVQQQQNNVATTAAQVQQPQQHGNNQNYKNPVLVYQMNQQTGHQQQQPLQQQQQPHNQNVLNRQQSQGPTPLQQAQLVQVGQSTQFRLVDAQGNWSFLFNSLCIIW